MAPVLLAVPNVSEGRNRALIDGLAQAFDHAPARVIDVHSDSDHNRSVFTLAGAPATLADAVIAGARVATSRIDMRRYDGVHPHVGALDVAPIVFLSADEVGSACAEALVLADRLGEELELPVLLYGALSGGRTRAELRRGGISALAARIRSGELEPDFGPHRMHPETGAVLVAARAPLVAFNLELAPPATVEDARMIAAAIREGGEEGLPGVRAIGVWLAARGRAQVSMNIENHLKVRVADVLAAVSRRARTAEAELVGLAPRAAFEGFPDDVPLRGRRTIEEALEGGVQLRSD